MKRIKNLFQLGKGFYILIFVLVLMAIFHRVTYSFVPLFTQYLIGVLTNHAALENVVNLGAIKLPSPIIQLFSSSSETAQVIVLVISTLLIWQLTRFIFMFFESYLRGYVLESANKKVRERLYKHMQDLPYSYHNNVDSGDLIQRATSDIETSVSFVTQRSIEFISLITALVANAYQMYFINPVLMWIALSAIPIFGTSSIWYFLTIDKVFKDVEEKEAQMMIVIQENVGGNKVVKSFGNEKFEIDKMEEVNTNFKKANLKANSLIATYWSLMDILMLLEYLIVILIGIYFTYNNIMDIAGVAASLMLLGNLIWPIRGLGRLISDFGKALVASDRIAEVMELQIEYIEDGHLTPPIDGKIEFKNVKFKFPDSSNYLFNNVSFTVNPGEKFAIIGKTGTGKTTLVNILLRMYDYEGSIKISGVELRDIQKKYIRENIAIAFQEPFLYAKTVYDNIALASRNNQAERIDLASEIAALKKDINTFQQGYETIVGERGITLSGGQKQRVAIARVLVDSKPILIFDDALSAVDTQTDILIRKALNKHLKDISMIFITHRISTASEADSVIVIEDGEITQRGSHQQLIKTEGLYKQLWDIQNEDSHVLDEAGDLSDE